MRRFFSLERAANGDVIALDKTESHHLLRVTGIAPGEEIEVFDGNGWSAKARFLRSASGIAELEVVEELPRSETDQHSVTLLLSLLKPTAFDLVLRMGTELGVTTFQPVQANRSVPKGDRNDRWNRIVLGAAKQSGRSRLPRVLPTIPLDEALKGLTEVQTKLIFVPGASAIQQSRFQEGRVENRGGTVAILIGPEGGWTTEEVALAIEAGCQTASLGDAVLRADTAAISAIVSTSTNTPAN